MQRIVVFIDRTNEYVGRATAWLVVVLAIMTISHVISRYVFRVSWPVVEELQWHVYAMIFLIGAGYTLLQDSHVRVDIFYARMSERTRAWVDVGGALVFLLPTVVFILWTSFPWAMRSYLMGETSPEPGGLPYRFIIKGMLPLGFILLGLQGVSQLVKDLQRALRT